MVSIVFAVLLGLVGQVGAASYTFDGSAGATLADGDTVTFPSGAISLTADCVYELSEDDAVATVQIGENVTSGEVTVKAGNATSMLLFDVASATSTIVVDVLNDLSFLSNEVGGYTTYCAVRGRGQVQFRLPNDKKITFKSDAADGDFGAELRVFMEQDRNEAADHSQIAFEKWSYEADETNTDLAKHSLIDFGRNSGLVFLSQLASGIADGGGAVDYGYGSVSFDGTNSGTGRLYVRIAGEGAGLGNDGSLAIYGNYIAGSGIDVTDVLNADLRGSVTYKYRAGVQAKIRIADRVAKAHFEGDADGWAAYEADATKRRGVVFLNYNKTFPLLANNYDQTTEVAAPEDFDAITGLVESKFFLANKRQTGFVLGNNGVIEVDNNRFFDFYACGLDDASLFPINDVHVADGATATTHAPGKVKVHNPSALIVDGYVYRRTGTTAAADDNFLYDSTDKAQILLRGNAGMFARVAASSETGEPVAATIDADGTVSGAEAFTGDYFSFAVGKGSYDGNYIRVLDGDGEVVSHTNEGDVALDIEGPLAVTSTASFDDVVSAQGWVNIPTLMVDHAGREVAFVDDVMTVLSSRPLSTAEGTEYYRYNTSNILVNDYVELNNVTVIHNEVSRDTSELPSPHGYPSIMGGELPSLRIAKNLTDRPLEVINSYAGMPLYMHNSTIACHESLVSAGVRWVVQDGKIEDALSQGDNVSRIVMYNRGGARDTLDTGEVRGISFVLGSRKNLMADGETIDPFIIDGEYFPQSSLRDAYIDIHRKRAIPHALNPDSDQTNTIRLEVATDFETGVEAYEKALHPFYLADRSSVNCGWYAGQFLKEITVDGVPTNVPHLEVDSRYEAWEFSPKALASVRAEDPENENEHRFSPYADGVGELRFTGDNIYVGSGGRYNEYGVLDPANNELSASVIGNGGGVLFADFGGKISVGDVNDIMLDTIIARRVSAIKAGAGRLALPSDQAHMLPDGRVEVYGFDADVDPLPQLSNNQASSIISINASDIPEPDDFTHMKSFNIPRRSPHGGRHFMTRATGSVNAPVPMPSSGLVVHGAGNVADQLIISGATKAKPFHLWLSGDGTGFARAREFVSAVSEPAILGEDAIAALILDSGARIGLGSRHFNEHSVRAWNQLGLDKVTLFPNGNCVVDLNSDLFIVDKLPLIATENFGQGENAHRITFYSEVPREIRILAGGELDLRSFGRGGAYKQQIEFAGNVKLVVEPGAKIRFPSTVTAEDPANGPVLYFNDNAELIFLGNDHPDRTRWTDGLTGSDKERTKLFGIGQIWLNKKAKCVINDNALVGVESDVDSPVTDLTISLQRDSSMYIGDGIRAGGAFQVGNMVDGGGDGSNARDVEGFVPTYIDFALKVNGEKATVHIDREGFFGLAAGVVNKDGNPNGDIPNAASDPLLDDNQYNAWRLQSLRNVRNVSLAVTQGYFDHNQIFDGSADQKYGSVMALGPIDYNDDEPLSVVNGGTYSFSLGKSNEAFLRGGGNLMYVDAGIPHSDPIPVSIWSASAALAGAGDSGKYTIMAPGVMVRTFTPFSEETIVHNVDTGTFAFTSRAVTDATAQGGALIEWYSIFGVPVYQGGYIPAGKGAGANVRAAYVVAIEGSVNAEVRRVIINLAKDKYGDSVSPSTALEKGYFFGTIPNANGDPETFGVQ